jgi:hypothetical protein
MVKEEVMARSDTRYSIYPAPKAVEVVGSTSPALNQAIECWAALLARALADNDKTFSQSFSDNIAGVWREQPLHEWGLLTEALNGIRFDPEFANPGDLLAAAVEDADRLENAGRKWFYSQFDEVGDAYLKGRDSAIKKLVKKLRELDYAHAWAVIGASRWFWEHYKEGIDIEKDQWWTLAFRRQWHEKQSGNERGGGTMNQRNGGNRRNVKKPSKQ